MRKLSESFEFDFVSTELDEDLAQSLRSVKDPTDRHDLVQISVQDALISSTK